MLYLVDEFFQKRALQRRVSSSVAPVGGGFLHVTVPTWLHVAPSPFGGEVVYENGVVGQAFAGVVLSDCEAELRLTRSDARYAVRLPWRGCWLFEELQLAIRTMPLPALVGLADSVQEGGLRERRSWRIDVLALVEQSADTPAAQQSAAAHALLGHVHEAVEGAGGSLEGVVELAAFGDRLANKAELAAEIYAIRFRLIVPELAKNSNRYAMRV